MVVVVVVVLEVVVGLNGAALVVVDVVLVDVVVVEVGNGTNVVVLVVDVDVDVDVITIMFRPIEARTGAEIVLNLNSTTMLPSPVVRKLVDPLYLVPPGVVGVEFVYNGPCETGVTVPAPATVT